MGLRDRGHAAAGANAPDGGRTARGVAESRSDLCCHGSPSRCDGRRRGRRRWILHEPSGESGGIRRPRVRPGRRRKGSGATEKPPGGRGHSKRLRTFQERSRFPSIQSNRPSSVCARPASPSSLTAVDRLKRRAPVRRSRCGSRVSTRARCSADSRSGRQTAAQPTAPAPKETSRLRVRRCSGSSKPGRRLHPGVQRTLTGEVTAYCLADGAPAWSQKLSSAAIRSIGGSDEMLFVGTPSGTLYAIQPPRSCM